MTTSTYRKTPEQMALENSAKKIVSQKVSCEALLKLQEEMSDSLPLIQSYHNNCKIDTDLLYIFDEFNRNLYSSIVRILHEKNFYSSVCRLAQRESAYFDEYHQEYDTFFKLANMAYLGLYSKLKKGENDKKLRIDTFLANTESIYATLRAYLRNNIIRDYARKISSVQRRFIPLITPDTDEDTSTMNWFQILKSNDNVEVDALPKFPDGMNSRILCSIMERFIYSKPVAAYIYLKILVSKYEPQKIATDLRTYDFEKLFRSVNEKIKFEFEVDLSHYNVDTFAAQQYIASLRSVSLDVAVSRIHKLTYTLKKDISKLEIIKELSQNHVRGNYYTA